MADARSLDVDERLIRTRLGLFNLGEDEGLMRVGELPCFPDVALPFSGWVRLGGAWLEQSVDSLRGLPARSSWDVLVWSAYDSLWAPA